MIFKYSVILLAAYVCKTAALPPCACTRDFTPVCGSDGHTYPNKCMLNCAHQTKQDLVLDRLGSCDEPGCICTLEYRPICGNDGKTYPNQCSLDCERSRNVLLEKRYDGQCRSEAIKVAELPSCTCTKELKPVCGSDGNTYSSPCLLKCAADATLDLSLSHTGPCADDAEPLPTCACTRNLQPVCGSNGVTYNNPCLLQCAASTDEAITMKNEGPCDKAVLPSCTCTRDLKQVCGTDGVTYNNDCLLNCAAESNPDLNVRQAGPCSEDLTVKVVEQPLPVCACTRNLSPVCGSDGISYSNKCMLDCAARNKSSLTMVHAGNCGSQVKVVA